MTIGFNQDLSWVLEMVKNSPFSFLKLNWRLKFSLLKLVLILNEYFPPAHINGKEFYHP